LFRILLEHLHRGGYVNDGLQVTSRDFRQAGIGGKYVTAATRVLEALGFIACPRRIRGLSARRWSNLWRPTSLPTKPPANDATHDYEWFKTRGEAKRVAEAFRFHDTRDTRKKELIDRLRKVSRAATP